MSDQQKGDLAEAQVIAELVRRGFTVSTPVTNHCPYDLVLDRGEHLSKVQVKHARLSDGKVECHLKRSNPNARGTKDTYYTEAEIDAYLLYCSNNETVYWIDFEDAPQSRIVLRTDADIEHPGIRWAEEYEL